MMTYFNRAIVCGTALFLVTGTASAQTEPGYTFTVSASTEKNGKPDGKPVLFKASVAGKNGRVDIVQGDSDGYKTGDFVLTEDAGQTFWTVNVKKREAKRLSPEVVRKLIAGEKFSVRKVSLTPSVPMGAGETVGGVGTSRFRTSRRYEIAARELFFSVSVAVAETWDFHVAASPANVPSYNPVVSFLALTNSAVLFKNDAFATGGYQKTIPSGFVVKVVAEAVSTEKKKQERESSVISCGTIAPATLDVSLFTVPNGFKRKE